MHKVACSLTTIDVISVLFPQVIQTKALCVLCALFKQLCLHYIKSSLPSSLQNFFGFVLGKILRYRFLVTVHDKSSENLKLKKMKLKYFHGELMPTS